MAKQDDIIMPTNMVKDILRIMKYGGHSPTYQNIYTRLYSYTTMLLFFCTFILQNIYIVTTTYEDFSIMIMDIVVLAAVWQIFSKTFTLHFKANYILQIIDIINNKVWTEDSLNEEDRKKSQEIYKYTLLITKSYTVSIYLTVFGHSITAVLRGNRNQIMNSWFPEFVKDVLFSTPKFEIFELLQLYLMSSCTIFGLLQIDNLFFTTIAIILAQLRMLKNKLLSLGSKDNDIDDSTLVIKCIDHHNLLYDAITIIETIYSGLILHVLASNMVLGVICLLGILLAKNIAISIIETIYSGLVLHVIGSNMILGVVCLLGILLAKNVTEFVEFIFILTSVFGQFFIYCLLGQLIQDDTLSVATAAYNSKWEETQDRSVKLSLLMTIQRSQKPARLTMGGFFDLCLENFTRISRLMFSILTLMVNMKVE